MVASIGSLGIGQWVDADTTPSFNVTATLEVGNIGILVIVLTDDFTTGETAYVTQVDDSAGNSYTKIKEYSFTDAFVTVSIWQTKATVELPITTGSVTITHADHSTQHRMASFWEFSGGTLAVNGTPDFFGTAASVSPTSRSVSGLTSGEYLFLRACGFLGGTDISNANWTPTASHTAFTEANNNSSPNGTRCRAEFIIKTDTGDTSNPTFTYASGYRETSILVALKETVGGMTPITVNVPADSLIAGGPVSFGP
jgi:hypothetical protein